MPTATADVLVVLPTLGDRLDTLERALHSAQSSTQGVTTRVIVVVPPDRHKARDLAKKYGAEVVDDQAAGMSAAINEGLARRAGEAHYIWLGDDDYYRPRGLATLLTLLTEHPDAVVAYGACDYVDDSGAVLWTSKAGSLARSLIGIGPNLIPHPAAMMRLDAVAEVGGYDRELSLVMDLDLLLKLKRLGSFVHTTEVVSAFGWHPQSLTVQDRKASGREARRVKRRHLPKPLRVFEPLWEYPVDWASRLAARWLNARQSSPRKR